MQAIKRKTFIATLSARNYSVLVDFNDLVLELRSNSLEFASLIVGGLPVGGTDSKVQSRFHCHGSMLTTRWFIVHHSGNEKSLVYKGWIFVLQGAFLVRPRTWLLFIDLDFVDPLGGRGWVLPFGAPNLSEIQFRLAMTFECRHVAFRRAGIPDSTAASAAAVQKRAPAATGASDKRSLGESSPIRHNVSQKHSR